jgi:hypothetical protein
MKSAKRSVSRSSSPKSISRKSPAQKRSGPAASKAPAPTDVRAAAKSKTGAGKANAAAPAVTLVEAHINVGFGNALYIRGQGAGLSWEKGLPLVCVNDSTWTWATDQASEVLQFKLLLNDQVWAQGEDLNVGPGQKVETEPVF